MAKDMINKVHIEGRVYNHTLQHKVSGEKSKNPGTPFIQGQINVATDEEGINVIPVRFSYVTEFYPKSGKPNDTYKVLSEIIDDGECWEKDGKEQAPQIRIDGDIAVNDFPGRDGEMVEAKQVRGSFVHFAQGNYKLNVNEDKRNTFEADMLIAAVIDQEVENGDDYINIRGYVFAYRNALVPVTFTVRNPGGISYFQKCDISNSNPLLTKVWGNIISTTQEIKTEVESAWGGPQVNVTTRTLRAWEVTGSSDVPYEWDDESTLTMAEFKKLMQQREETKALAKKDAEEYQARRANQNNAFSAKNDEPPFSGGKVAGNASPTAVADFKF